MTVQAGKANQIEKQFFLTPKVLDLIAENIPRQDFNGEACTFKFLIQDVTSPIHLFETNPNKISEDRQKQTDIDFNEVTVLYIYERLQILFTELGSLDDLLKSFMYHRYPRLSWFWCFLLVVFVLSFNPTYILSYLLGVVTLVFALHHPDWRDNWAPIL